MIHLIRKFINTENTALNVLIDEGNEAVKSKIGTTVGYAGDTGGSATAGTVMGKLNALLTNWTSTRAGYIDNIRSYTVTNNTASKTGVLSAKLSYLISLLESTTYGLSAIKTAASGSVIKSVQRGTITISSGTTGTATISPVNTNKAIVLYGGSVLTTEGHSSAEYSKVWDSILTLTNSTTVTAYRAYDAGKVNVPYQVIEFY